MAAQLPEVPKISGYIEPLTRPEAEIESRIKEATRITPPPGPNSLILGLAQAVEEKGTPELPTAPRVEELLPKGLPKLPEVKPEAEVGSKVVEAETKAESKIAGEKKPAKRELSSKIA